MGLPWLEKSDMWKNWDRGGKNTFLKELAKCINPVAEDEGLEGTENGDEDGDGVSAVGMRVFQQAAEIVAIDDGKDKEFVEAIYTLVKNGCNGTLKKEKVVMFLTELSTTHPYSPHLVVESFAVLDEETSVREELRDKFISIVRMLDGMLGILLAERLNMDNLVDIGLVSNKKSFNTRFIRIKTRTYFKQQKYNLFREESEGYAKLISEVSPPYETKKSDLTTQIIQCLIGRFNLDPNRVIDLVLEAFERNHVCSFFIPLLKNLNPSSETVCELLGFKLQNQDSPADDLFLQIALLLQHKIIRLDEMFSWLTPDDRFIRKDWERQLKDAKEYARKSMIVTINKEKEEETEDLTSPDDRFSDNQKFCLCEALLIIGDWDHAAELMSRYPNYACVSRKRIALRLIRLIEYIIEPLYATARRNLPNMGASEAPKLECGDKAPPPAESFGQLENYVDMILAIGPYLYHEPLVLYKLLRIIRYYVQKTGHQKAMYYKFLSVFDEVILPAISFMESNCAITEEVWRTLEHYPYHHRFRLYGSWKGESMLINHPCLLRKRVDLVKKIKHLMRRISKENVKPMGRQLGKLAHSMPAVVFDYILSQIQLFDNLIAPVIDALKFLTTLCYDVLGYCLLEALSPASSSSASSLSVMLMPNRPRTKHDGSTIASWLQNLSSFTGAICKKYNVELVPILQYVSNQLKAKQGLDLLLLKEIVQKMTGVEAAEEMTTEQLDAMAGGEMLRSEAGYFGQIRSSKKSGARLREAVSANDLAVTLCILMAQQRNCIVYEETQALHTKLVGKLYDQCQDTLVQFGTFLANSCTMDDYSRKIPTLDRLVKEYHVSPDVAFFLWRPIFAFLIGARYDELRRAEKNHKAMTVAQRQEKYTEASNVIFTPIAEIMRNFFPAKIWDDISPQFYVTFWSLSLFDVFVPTDAYNREISRVKHTSIAFGDNKDLPSSKRKKEQERCQIMIEKLQDEERRQREHVDRVMHKLNKEKDAWFASRIAKSAKNEAVTAFLQHCLFPRCIFTATDAQYCANFVHIIHSLSTPNFSTLICYDRIFCDIIYTVTSCTENEANRYGRFLCALLGTVMKWHGDKSVFDRECASFPGFVTKFRAANTVLAESSDHVDYENFRHVCHKWHYKITKCVIVCLESKDFIQIRNALIVLKRILPYYPKVQNLATAVERWIERVRTDEKDKRQDIFALATSYIGQLKAKWNSLIAEEDFHHKAAGDKSDKQGKAKAVMKDEKPATLKEKKKMPSTSTPSIKTEPGSTNVPTAPVASKDSASPKVTNGPSATSTVPDTPPHGTNIRKEPLENVTVTIKREPGTMPTIQNVKKEISPHSANPKPDSTTADKVVPRKEHVSATSLRKELASGSSSGSKKDLPQPSTSPNKDSSVTTSAQQKPSLPDPSPQKTVAKRSAKEATDSKDGTKERRTRIKARNPDSVAANGSSSFASGPSTSPLSSTPSSSPSNSSVSLLSEDRDKKDKRKEKKPERKREHESVAHVDLKRKRTDETYKTPSDAIRSQRPSRSVSLTNGEQLDKDKIMSSKEDRTPRHSSRDRGGGGGRSILESPMSKGKHSRYK